MSTLLLLHFGEQQQRTRVQIVEKQSYCLAVFGGGGVVQCVYVHVMARLASYADP